MVISLIGEWAFLTGDLEVVQFLGMAKPNV
jgi:hypothetical protein